jgi:hypothetical protein
VPPTVNHICVNRTATPVFGSATADTSATVRRAQPVSVCHAGLVSKALHPLPAPLHALSLQPRAVPGARVSDVPPTAVTKRDAAGYETPKPASPELAVIAMPGWSKCASSVVSVLVSSPPQLLLIAFAPSRAAVSTAA